MLYSSTMPVSDGDIEPADANTYRPFKVMDSIIMKSIADEIEALGEPETEGMYGRYTIWNVPDYGRCRTHWFRRSSHESNLLYVTLAPFPT